MNTSVAPQFASSVLQRGAYGFALTSGLQLLAGTRGCCVVCCTTLPTALSLSTGPLLTLCSSSCLFSSLGLSRLFLNFLQSGRKVFQSLLWMILLCVGLPPAPHFLHMRPKSLPSVALSTSWWTCARETNRKSAVCGTRSLNFALVWPPPCLPAHCPLPHLAQSALASVTFQGLTHQFHAAGARGVLFRFLIHVLLGTAMCIGPVVDALSTPEEVVLGNVVPRDAHLFYRGFA